MDKSREQFEAWALSHGMPIRKMPKYPKDYFYRSTHSCWAGWQASRAALVVELPIQCETTLYQGDFEDGYESGYNESLKDAKEKLLKAGIKCS